MKWRSGDSVRIIAFIDQGVVSAGNFVAGVLMARIFGAYQLGWFALAWIIVEFMASLQFAAILQPMLNIGAKEEKEVRTRYYSATAVQQAVVCAVSALLIWSAVRLAAPLLEPGVERLAIPLSLTAITFQAHNFFRRYLFVRDKATLALGNDALRVGLQLTALLMLPYLWSAYDSVTGIWIIMVACGVSSIRGAFVFGRFEWRAATFSDVLRRHWAFSKWLLPSAVMFWMTSQAFVLMSGAELGAAATGALKAAISIAGVTSLLLQALDSFAPMQAARALHEGGPRQLIRYMIRLSCLTATLLFAMLAVLMVDTEALVRLLYGSGYEGLGYVVRWLCPIIVAYSLSVLLGIWAAAIECTRMIFVSYAIATAFTVVAAYPMTRYLGMEGVLLGSLVVEVVKVVALLVPLARWMRTTCADTVAS